MSNKINAVVGLARCPKHKKLYGVRVEIEGKKWTATWAFPIKDEVAKREGFQENQFPSDLKYAPKYPGCPYCRQFEDLAKISYRPAPAPKKDIKIAVTSRCYDDIGAILNSLNIKYSSFSSTQYECDILFINCGTSDPIDNNKLRNFVEKGGCVYASDWANVFMEGAFSSLFDFEGRIGEQGSMTAMVIDPELRKIVGESIKVEYDLGAWAVLNGCKGDVLLKSGYSSMYRDKPIMVRVKYGRGTIFYTCFHNHAQASEQEQALLQLLVLKQIANINNTTLEEGAESVGVDLDEIKSKFRSNY